ncbi:uncharacterized protein PITG_06276 [Phytophthora infestans T30-4]|uniref:Integrase catalytic domain-containing protein n=1 Tax=Phytophthora infestans (strain T30-4) TaxID=403677 RepID=D0N4H6_PHYIT|nr:uncharacterized protein PITG_06276 [Phytophthora infestans T30-4]EEY69784.1 hypothetical protein PITG_06276 [Phytophthora infestans T30-4]|eukprot:XP_002998431.1 hypothetical protein PITG_06276 [Phytophthora infestans T30-4]
MTQCFTLAHCPWINGSIERLNGDVLQVLRANLNHISVTSLANGKYSPAEVLLGAVVTTPLLKKQTKRNKSNQRGAKSVSFHVGDFVLWSRAQAKTRVNKLSVKWIGPYHMIVEERVTCMHPV